MSDAKIIKPTNGRIVWFTPGIDFMGKWYDRSQPTKSKPLAAIICHVWGDRMVNLDVIDSDGIHWPVTSVDLVQPGDSLEPFATHKRFCEWMPYQVGQAAKTDDAAGKLKEEIAALRGELDMLRSRQANKNEEIEQHIAGIMSREPVYANDPNRTFVATTVDPGHRGEPSDFYVNCADEYPRCMTGEPRPHGVACLASQCKCEIARKAVDAVSPQVTIKDAGKHTSQVSCTCPRRIGGRACDCNGRWATDDGKR